ncbi:MAG: ABC transporter permease [Acidimicrobiia bacterium]|nr:ABC transporter permease [Acidimicrobiia bacterium]
MTTSTGTPLASPPTSGRSWSDRPRPGGWFVGMLRVFEHNVVSYRRMPSTLLSGVVEPLLYLLGLGYGMGAIIGDLEYRNEVVGYAAFVGPGLMASSAMNGALFDTTYNFFFKLTESKQYHAMLSTPLTLGGLVAGEQAWAVARGAIYSGFFVVTLTTLGLADPLNALAAWPATLLTGWAFGALGAALTTYARAWTDFDMMDLVVQPMFLASTAFFPLMVFPEWAQRIVWATPLFHAVDLTRALALGQAGPADLVHVAYLVAMGLVFGVIARRRLNRLLLD